ncbi:MAG: hypothetical protein ACKPCG_22480 [Dolichospermum sp.]
MKEREPGIHNLTPEIIWEQIEDLEKIGITLESGLELGLAHSVIINTLGGDFYIKECTSYGDKQKFFRNKADTRIIHLAHMLWCLRIYSGFQEFLERNRKVDFESAYYEVTAAHWFSRVAESICFVIPTGVKGSDFDIKVNKFLSYDFLYVEVKARQQAFTNKNQIQDLFNKARKQLPENGNGVIFCKLELSEKLKQEDFIHAAQSCLKTSNRISFIVFCWDAWTFLEEAICLKYFASDKDGEMHNIFGENTNLLNPAFLVEANEWYQRKNSI